MNIDEKIIQLTGYLKMGKFEKDESIFYPGLSNEEYREELVEMMNLAAIHFMSILRNHPSKEGYQSEIKIILDQIDKDKIDTEDEGRICMYFEQLMDIVDLADSGGHLNKWRYGFDPS
jgi:hypothetical protein